MAPGAAIALSFNTLTLPSSTVREALAKAGLKPLEDEPYINLKHEVEQAVIRDVVFACNT
jgi:ABC-type nitrate/sulfonate/bicarbonate transport system substrate-binding protein